MNNNFIFLRGLIVFIEELNYTFLNSDWVIANFMWFIFCMICFIFVKNHKEFTTKEKLKNIK